MFEFETQTKNCIKGSLYSNSVFLKKKKKNTKYTTFMKRQKIYFRPEKSTKI